jgi:hypothetical protein
MGSSERRATLPRAKLTGHYSALSMSACPVSFATGGSYTTFRDTTSTCVDHG